MLACMVYFIPYDNMMFKFILQCLIGVVIGGFITLLVIRHENYEPHSVRKEQEYMFTIRNTSYRQNWLAKDYMKWYVRCRTAYADWDDYIKISYRWLTWFFKGMDDSTVYDEYNWSPIVFWQVSYISGTVDAKTWTWEWFDCLAPQDYYYDVTDLTWNGWIEYKNASWFDFNPYLSK